MPNEMRQLNPLKNAHLDTSKVFLTAFVLFQLMFSPYQLAAQVRQRMDSPTGKIFFAKENDHSYKLRDVFTLSNDSTGHENPRLIAIALDLTLGLLGMHRLYLGTDLKVPILYTITLGGGGILWLVDLGLLIFTPDITPYMNHPGVFMWTGK